MYGCKFRPVMQQDGLNVEALSRDGKRILDSYAIITAFEEFK